MSKDFFIIDNSYGISYSKPKVLIRPAQIGLQVEYDLYKQTPQKPKKSGAETGQPCCTQGPGLQGRSTRRAQLATTPQTSDKPYSGSISGSYTGHLWPLYSFRVLWPSWNLLVKSRKLKTKLERAPSLLFMYLTFHPCSICQQAFCKALEVQNCTYAENAGTTWEGRDKIIHRGISETLSKRSI